MYKQIKLRFWDCSHGLVQFHAYKVGIKLELGKMEENIRWILYRQVMDTFMMHFLITVDLIPDYIFDWRNKSNLKETKEL